MSHQPDSQPSLPFPSAAASKEERGGDGLIQSELISKLVQDVVRSELAKSREVQEELLGRTAKLLAQLQELVEVYAHQQPRKGHASPQPLPSNAVAAQPRLPLAVIPYGNTEENLLRLATQFLLAKGINHYLKPELVEAPREAHQLVLLVAKSLTERKPKPSEVASFIDEKCRGKVVVVVWVRHGDRPAVLQGIEKPTSSYAAIEVWYTNYNELRLADTDRNEVARAQLTEALHSVGVLPADSRDVAQTPQRLECQREERSWLRKFF